MQNKPLACTIEAPCKINLHLKVTEKRPDGFHNLESIFASLAFADTLRFECAGDDSSCSVEMTTEPHSPIPLQKNLVYKAVSLFREKTGFNQGLCIQVTKRIPVGAGLGGGSSDAASTLLALNFLAANSGACGVLTIEELREMAALLGSDVPFFLTGGTAWASGRGDRIEPVKTPEGLFVVLVKPSFSSDTAAAFRLLDEYRNTKNFNHGEHGEGEFRKGLHKSSSPRSGDQNSESITPINSVNSVLSVVDSSVVSSSAVSSILEQDPQNWPFFNDFLPAFVETSSSDSNGNSANGDVYNAILEELNKLGAGFAGLSGSGSCCFGVFNDRQKAEIAKCALKVIKSHEFFTQLTFFLALPAIPVLE